MIKIINKNKVSYKSMEHHSQNKLLTEKNKMTTLKEAAMAYVPPQTLNIADMEKIPVNIELKDGKGKEGTPDEFTYKYVELEGKKYRVAGSIIGGLKALAQKMPNLEFVSVLKQGSGMNTRYQVIPYTDPNQQ